MYPFLALAVTKSPQGPLLGLRHHFAVGGLWLLYALQIYWFAQIARKAVEALKGHPVVKAE
jgi:hypothetical protein